MNAFRLPIGAPGDGPPCIRHRPLGIAGDWHGFPFRGPCSASGRIVHRQVHGVVPPISSDPLPRGLNHPDNGLTAGLHGDVLNDDFLLTFPPMPIQRFE